MANELEIMPNPDNIPGAASTGYQRQNTNFYAIMTGYNSSCPYRSFNNVIIPAGGIIEVNGGLYKIIENVTLPIPSNSQPYAIKLTQGEEGFLTPQLTTDFGIFDYNKNGRYTNDGCRVLEYFTSYVDNILQYNNNRIFQYENKIHNGEIVSTGFVQT